MLGAWLALVPSASLGAGAPVAPDRQLLDALVSAGGGSQDFKTLNLIGVLAGPNANDEVARLVRTYGAAEVKAFIVTFDALIADALRLAGEGGRSDAAVPSSTSGTDGGALFAALSAAGRDPATGTFRAQRLLDRLLSPTLRKRPSGAAGGTAAGFRVLLQRLMTDLASRRGR
jgi:hypothetical protein